MSSRAKHRTYGLLNAPVIRLVVKACVRAAARLWIADAALRVRVHELLKEQPADVAGSIVGWVASVRVRKRQPRYSIRGWLIEPEQRQATMNLLRSLDRSSSDIRRELLLLDASPVGPAALQLASEYLDRRFRGAASAATSSYSPMGEPEASDALMDVAAAFSRTGGRMFLVSGTFLGAIRTGRFVESDYDVDVGFFADEVEIEDLYREMVRCEEFSRVQCLSPWMIKADHRNGVRIDVFAHFNLADGIVAHGSDAHQWWNSSFDLTPVRLDGVEYLGPADADRYLTENYGNWRTRVGFWDWAVDTPNHRTPLTTDALFTMVGYAVAGDRRRAEEALLALRDVFDIDYTEYVPSGLDILPRTIPIPAREVPRT